MTSNTLPRPPAADPRRAGATGRALRWLMLALVLTLTVALDWPALAAAQPAASVNVEEAETALSEARQDIDALRKGLDKLTDDAELLQRRTDALDIQSKADRLAEALAPQLASVAARLTELGKPTEGAKEAPDVAQQRAQLEKSNRNLDAQIKLARLLSVEAAQTAEQISTLRRTQFQARLGERRDSFVSSSFWSELRGDLPRDLERLAELRRDVTAMMAATPGWAWAALAAVAAIVLALRYWFGQLMVRLTATRVPPGRLRRSFLAVAIVLLSVATPGLIAELFKIGLVWRADIGEDTSALLDGLVAMVCFGGYVTGLGYALLSPDRPSWRLPAIPDEVASGLRWAPAVLGTAIVAVWLAERLPVLLNASLTSTIAVNSLAVLLLGVALLWILLRGERLRRKAQFIEEENRPAPRPFWIAAINTVTWALLLFSLLAMLIGFAALGGFVIRQVFWTLVVLTTAYLASVLIEDGFSTLLGSGAQPKDGEAAQSKVRVQAAVLLSGVGRVLVILTAAILLLAPFGEGPADLAHRFDQLHRGLQIGEVQLRPGALVQALLVLALSLVAVRLLKRWLTNRYLPSTELDPGMQISAATLFGYAGVVIAVALALSALGIGLERVAWIASALSVGIGFGLQAVVQNFVSGLILLAERPVKVGDWVSLGGVEGDILRINVRATEIQMGDRSTVIVPNSEFITKTVRNVTHANPLGLVQIKLPMPLSSNAAEVRQLLLDAFTAHADILATPEPNVFLDGFDAGHLVFNAKGYVSSPRLAYGVRSAILFDVLQRLADAGLDMAPPSTFLLRDAEPSIAPAPISQAAADPREPEPR
ncbi:MAG: DUF3772 domain-containing protein [Bordetella sp.]|nr:DUF3772 domain-containing protein [Bordetella sp.]